MKYSPNREELKKAGNNIVHIIAIVYLVLTLIAELALVTIVAMKIISAVYLLVATVVGAIQLILLFSLDDAIKRISILEYTLLKKGTIEIKEISLEAIIENEDKLAATANENDLKEAGIKFCEQCGYMLSSEDKECPVCGLKVESDENDNK